MGKALLEGKMLWATWAVFLHNQTAVYVFIYVFTLLYIFCNGLLLRFTGCVSRGWVGALSSRLVIRIPFQGMATRIFLGFGGQTKPGKVQVVVLKKGHESSGSGVGGEVNSNRLSITPSIHDRIA